MVVWGISSEDRYADLVGFTDQMGLTYPVLFDDGGLVHDQYNPGDIPTNSLYPQDWIIGADGRVRYVNTIYDPVELMAGLDAELDVRCRVGERVVGFPESRTGPCASKSAYHPVGCARAVEQTLEVHPGTLSPLGSTRPASAVAEAVGHCPRLVVGGGQLRAVHAGRCVHLVSLC